MHSLQAVVASLTRHTQPSASGGQHWALAEQEKRELARQVGRRACVCVCV
jgi:hypothetical protein